MAEKSDKQFDPTPQRIRKAREEGNVFKAQDMVSIISLTVGASVLALGMSPGFGALKSLAQYIFLHTSTTALSVDGLLSLIVTVGIRVLIIIIPFMLILMFAGVGANVLQSGWNVSMKPLVPKPENISPLKGLKRIFSPRGMFTTVKAVLKIVIVGPVAYFSISGHIADILMLHTLQLSDILTVANRWIIEMVGQLLVLLFVLAGIDFAFEKWRHKEDMKMSMQEIKDEQKETDGDPKVKSKRRQLAMNFSRRPRLDYAVMKADVVVTNPTHYAVVLRYDPEEAPAPMVLAKGMRKRAQRIKALASEIGVPMVENRPLARALYASVDEESEIPADLYPAVAAILAEIYRKEGRRIT